MMISHEELNPRNYPMDQSQLENYSQLYDAINLVRQAYGNPMLVTSGFRSPADQQRINPKNPQSAHTQAAAVDISDPDGALWDWCLAHSEELAAWGLYLEARAYTPRWVHFQVIPPRSGHRIFIP